MSEESSTKVKDIKIKQHRSVLLIAQSVSFIVAIAMIGYAGATLNFLFDINFDIFAHLFTAHNFRIYARAF